MTSFVSIRMYKIVNRLLIRTTTERLRIIRILSQDVSARDKTIYCPAYALLGHQTATTENGTGVPLVTHVAILSRGTRIMLTSKNPALGTTTQSRTALTLFAATLLVGGSITEASAKSHRHHHHGYRHSHHASSSLDRASSRGWRNANAAIDQSSGSGRSFSGIASFYGNESGSKTASGQRFNQNL